MNAEFIKYLKGWSEREAAMATADDMELWCTTQGLGVECDDVEIREDELCTECEHPIRLHGDKYGCQYELGDTFDGSRAKPPCGCKEFPANTPVQEEGVVVLPAGSHSHSLKSVPVAEQGSKAAREGLQSPPKATACDWLREQGIFMDAGDL